MKLHLPPPFLAALLTAFCSVPSITMAAPEVVTDANGYKTATYSDKEATSDIDVSVYTANDTIIFQLPKDVDANYFKNENISTDASVIIGSPGSTEINDSTGLIISNGYGNAVEFSGTVSGSGTIYRTGKGIGSAIIFSGDVTAYTGNIYIGTNEDVNFTLTFGGKTDAVQASATTSTQGVAGTGDITFGSASSKLVFNYSAAENPVYITNTISESGTTVNGSTLTLKGGADYKFTKSVKADIINVSGGSLTFKSEEVNVVSSQLNITHASVKAEASFTSNKTIIGNDATVKINAGGSLELSGHDVVGWNGGESAAEFILAGEEDALAKLIIKETGTDRTTTLGTNITMNGNTLFEGNNLNTWGAKLSVSGINNTVDVTNLSLRKELEITINDEGELTLGGSLSYHSEGATSGGKITKKGNGLLYLTAELQEDVPAISIEAGGLSITRYGVVVTEGKTDNEIAAQKNDIFNKAEADSQIETTGTGYILLNTDEYTLKEGDHSLAKNYKVDGGFSINGAGYDYDGGKRTFTVGADKMFLVTGALNVVSRAELLIDGGSVTAGSMALGHATVSGSGQKTYQGYLRMTSGSLSTGTISFNRDLANVIDITGGSVEFTAASALNRGSNTGSTINITGTDATAPVVLKATTTDWTLDGSGFTTTPTLGNIEIDDDNTHAITLKNVALSGSVVNNHLLTLDGAKGVNIASLGGTGDTDITGDDTDVFNVESVDSGMLTITGSATVNITGRGTANELDCLRSAGGTTNITTQTLTINGNGEFDSTHKDGLYIKNSTVNIGDGTQSTKVTVSRVEMGDATDQALVTYADDELNIAKNATLVVLGTDVTSGGNQYHKTGFLLGEWGKQSTLNIEGAVYAKDASVMVGDKEAIINVESGGVLATKGFRAQSDAADKTRHITLNVKDGAKLILGATGIGSNHKDYAVTFGNAEIGITAESSITENITLTSAQGTTFNTTLYTWNEAGDTVTAGTEGSKVTISGVISDSSEARGKLIKSGTGSLELSGNNTYSGGTEVQAGTLVATKGAALGNGGVVIKGGSVEITDGTAKITVGKRADDVDATINKSAAYSLDNGDVDAANDRISILNSRMIVESADDVTITHQIGGEQSKTKNDGDYASVLVNKGAGLLTTTNGYNNYAGLEAINGNINVLWSNTGFQGDLQYLLIEAERTVAVHTNADRIDSVANLAKLTVAEAATFGNNAKLHADLELQSGAEVSLGSGVVVEGTLTLGRDMTLDGAQYEALLQLKNEVEQRVVLFSNVDALKLSDAATFSTNSAVVDYTGAQDLSNFFSNVETGLYLLEFDQNVVYATLIPEPATTTLSLLALTGLAARRRRRR